MTIAAEDYEALKCRYPSKKCWNQRAVKRNGERHNLCEVHRQKANNNQRRLDKKRKAGHSLLQAGSSSDPTNNNESDVAGEYDSYRRSASPSHLHAHHAHHHPYHRPAPAQHTHHAALTHANLQLQQQQHALAQHYHEQQEKRLRASLTNMYAAAQALSPPSSYPDTAHLAVQQQHSPHSTFAPLRSPAGVVAPPPRQMLHLPPLTSHIPSRVKTEQPSSLLLQPPTTGSPPASRSRSASSASSSASSSPVLVKPTILLPPLTSAPRCYQPSPFQLPLAGSSSAVASTSWRVRSEEKVNLA